MTRVGTLICLLIVLCAGVTSGTWLALDTWQAHNQKHLTMEAQIKELQAYLNVLLQERAQRAR